MLPQSTIAEVARLLREGKLSQRKIADRLQISRGTVGAIAGGGRGLHGRLPNEDELELFVPCSPPKRCPRCGYRVYLPCLICNTRQFQERAGVSLTKQFAASYAGRRRRPRRQRQRARPRGVIAFPWLPFILKMP